uniref:Wsv285-like protein n=1 Tax=Penaeus japonicus TaxID=27405 RepID=A0A2Z6BEG6_PENJP|nr:wsv285-like protein [Penaeus japonicus]BDT61738.1 MAG: wsv285-like protein [Marsupenaeus japonicus endogenous nimavirus]
MEAANIEKIIEHLLTLANKRKSVNVKNYIFDKDSIKSAIRTKQTDENGWNDIIRMFDSQEEYLKHSRLSIMELGQCKYPIDLKYNGEELQTLTEDDLEGLYKEGVCWNGIVLNSTLVVTVNIILDIIQHMGGNELWLFNRIHNDISKLNMKVKTVTEPLPENWAQSPIWTSTYFSYVTIVNDMESMKAVLNAIGCQIQGKGTEHNNKFTQICYSFRFTDTALGHPMELSMGSGCFHKSGQNVPMERKDGNATNKMNGEDINMTNENSFVMQMMDGGKGYDMNNSKHNNKYEDNKTEISYIFRGKFPTIGPRNNFDEHKYIAKKYIAFLDHVLSSLSTPRSKIHNGNVFNVTNDKYESTLAIYLALIHPKTKFRFLLSLFLTVVLMRTRGLKPDAEFDSKKKTLSHGRETKVSHMDHTGPRFRMVCETCVCKSVCKHAHRYYPHALHSHDSLPVKSNIDDPMMSYKKSDFNIEEKCYPNRVIHQHFCSIVFPCKRAKQSEILLKNNQLSMRQKDSKLNVPTYTEELLNGMTEYHRQSCPTSMVEEYLNSMVLKSWDIIRDTAKKNGMSYKDLVLEFIKIPLIFGNIERMLNTDYYNDTSNNNVNFKSCCIFYKKHDHIKTAFEALSLFFDYDIKKIYTDTNLSNICDDKDGCLKKIKSGLDAVAFLTNKKAASFLTTINNHFYIMSHTALSGFRHKCELTQQGLTNQEGLMFHQIALQNYSLICSPDYLSKNDSQQNIIDDAVIEGITSDRNDNTFDLLDLTIREEIDDIINNKTIDIFKTTEDVPTKEFKDIQRKKTNGHTMTHSMNTIDNDYNTADDGGSDTFTNNKRKVLDEANKQDKNIVKRIKTVTEEEEKDDTDNDDEETMNVENSNDSNYNNNNKNNGNNIANDCSSNVRKKENKDIDDDEDHDDDIDEEDEDEET